MHAFIAASRRSDATVAAILVARALAASGPTTLVRVAPEGRPAIPEPFGMPEGLTLKQAFSFDATAAETAFGLAAKSVAAGHRVVLDLPGEALADPRIAGLGEAAMLAIGPDLLDEREAASLLTRHWPGARAPVLALGASRHGGKAAALHFQRRFTWLVAEAGGIPGPIASVVTPPLNPREQEELLDLRSDEHVLALGTAFANAIRGIAGAERGERVGVPHLLRSLAEDLLAIDRGDGPSREELAAAPVLDDWSYRNAPRRVLSGRVRNHPRIPDGRRVATSDLYACDGRSFARTLSRFYALGRRAT